MIFFKKSEGVHTKELPRVRRVLACNTTQSLGGTEPGRNVRLSPTREPYEHPNPKWVIETQNQLQRTIYTRDPFQIA